MECGNKYGQGGLKIALIGRLKIGLIGRLKKNRSYWEIEKNRAYWGIENRTLK